MYKHQKESSKKPTDRKNELITANEKTLVTKNFFVANRTCKNVDCGKNGVCVKKPSGKTVVYFCRCNANGVLQKNSCSNLKKTIEDSFKKIKRSVKTKKRTSQINDVKVTNKLVKFSALKKGKKPNGKQPVKKGKTYLKTMHKNKQTSVNKNQKKPKKNNSKFEKFLRKKINPKFRKYSEKKLVNAE